MCPISPRETLAMWRGRQRERQAEIWLQQQGLKLLQRNYRCKAGEIDLVMRDAQWLVFVEVRYRKSRQYGSASESVTHRKQQRLILAAQHFLLCKPALQSLPCRFDVVAIHGRGTPRPQPESNPANDHGQSGENTLEWIANAFQA